MQSAMTATTGSFFLSFAVEKISWLPTHGLNSELTSTNQQIPCACHDFAPGRRRTADFSHRATKSSGFSCHARFPAPATQNDAPRRTTSHHSPRLPRETHAEQRQSAHFPTPATRIHRLAPSQAATCILSPTPATRNDHETRLARLCLANPNGTALRGHTRTLAVARADAPRTRSTPQTPTQKQEPFATRSGKMLKSEH